MLDRLRHCPAGPGIEDLGSAAINYCHEYTVIRRGMDIRYTSRQFMRSARGQEELAVSKKAEYAVAAARSSDESADSAGKMGQCFIHPLLSDFLSGLQEISVDKGALRCFLLIVSLVAKAHCNETGK